MPKKRGHGEGSVYKRKDGFWTAQVTVQGKQIYKYFKTQRDALDWVHETRTQIKSGVSVRAASITLQGYLDEWLVAHKSAVRPKTIYQYSQIVRQHIVPVLGKIKLKDLNPNHIQSLYNFKIESGVSKRSVVLIHSILHKALNQAMKWELIGRNPAQAVTRPKVARKEMKTLTDSQARTFLSAAKESRYEMLYWLAISTGMRQGELLGLKWSDLDWTSGSLQVQRQLQRTESEGLVFSEPKSLASNRSVLISIGMLEKLRNHLDYQLQEKRLLGEKWKEYDLMFPSTIGTPADHRNLYSDFKKTLKRAELPDMRFHDLRHTAATLMLEQGVHPKVVQERLGHADITLTLNTYSHVMPSMQESAAQKMDELLNPIEISSEINEIR